MIDLEKELENFNKKLHTEGQAPEPQTPQHKATQEITLEKIVSTQEVEHIPATPTSKIVLRIEEIPPLDVFYSPLHKVVVRRKRKRRRIEVSKIPPGNEPMDIV